MTKLEQLVERLRALGYEARAVASTERSYGPAADYAKLTEKQFSEVLGKVTTLEELEGIANRRKILNLFNHPKYPPGHLDLIKRRKWELENA
tara:strand:+ start:498 stop:773 length:276 start_codon:yes stop_codon:yes gene_type:complete